MEITPLHFVPSLLPSERIYFLKVLARFDNGLREILQRELQRGNRIVSVYHDSIEGQISVNLLKSFVNDYSDTGSTFEISNDAHDGGASYFGRELPGHRLTAPVQPKEE